MSGSELLVTFGGLAAIAWVNWYFFHAPAAAAVADTDGLQRFRIEVDNGYEPAAVRVRAGRPVRLEFHRVDRSSCTEEVVIPDFGIRTFLPTQRTTAVEFTPSSPGTHEFACGMGMVRGKIIVEEREGDRRT
ncbi:MAG TPA: cupredoxin domain-containing protein [Gemmatimonadales bacterium]|nr:cupredoxin domain-containing protein [Gemmatimonadales bacterium]